MKYDFILNLGETCATSIALRELGLQDASYPFDWSAGILHNICGECGLKGKVEMISNHFFDAFNFEDYEEFEGEGNNFHRFIRNKKTGLQYVHDFSRESSVESQFDEYKSKYSRRVERFFKKIESSERILVLFVARWNSVPLDDILYSYDKLKQQFKKNIDFLVLQKREKYLLYETDAFTITPNITCINYCDDPTTTQVGLGNLVAIKKIIMNFIGGQYFSFAHEKIQGFGFYHQESFGVFTNGHNSVLKFYIADKKNINIRFQVVPYLRDRFMNQKVSCYLNEYLIEIWKFDYNDYTNEHLIHLSKKIYRSIKIKKDLICDNCIILKFYVHNPVQPHSIEENNDMRNIGLAFVDALITEE